MDKRNQISWREKLLVKSFESDQTLSGRRIDIDLDLLTKFIDEVEKETRLKTIQEVDNSRDHDSCECDNCHRWRRFYKTNTK